jgi:hypothetical protein
MRLYKGGSMSKDLCVVIGLALIVAVFIWGEDDQIMPCEGVIRTIVALKEAN